MPDRRDYYHTFTFDSTIKTIRMNKWQEKWNAMKPKAIILSNFTPNGLQTGAFSILCSFDSQLVASKFAVSVCSCIFVLFITDYKIHKIPYHFTSIIAI